MGNLPLKIIGRCPCHVEIVVRNLLRKICKGAGTRSEQKFVWYVSGNIGRNFPDGSIGKIVKNTVSAWPMHTPNPNPLFLRIMGSLAFAVESQNHSSSIWTTLTTMVINIMSMGIEAIRTYTSGSFPTLSRKGSRFYAQIAMMAKSATMASARISQEGPTSIPNGSIRERGEAPRVRLSYGL